MNTKFFVALSTLALAASFGARAQEATPDTWMKPAQSSTTTRAEVKADLAKARAAGQLDVAAQYELAPKPVAQANTREQVRAELARARAAGELEVAAQYNVFDKPVASSRTRAEVRAEVLEAIAEGQHLSRGDRS